MKQVAALPSFCLVLLIFSSACGALRLPLNVPAQTTAADGKQGLPQPQQQQQQQAVQAQQGLQPPQPWQPYQQLQQQIQQQMAPNMSQQQQAAAAMPVTQGLPPPQPWQPLQQLQQQIQQQLNPQNSSNGTTEGPDVPTKLKPTQQFISMPQQQRPAEMQEAQQQQKQQQEAQASPENYKCGKPNMPCGSAIPEGKKCEKGPGWCEPGYFCGFETTTAEPSKCLPIPKDCGKAGNPCCPSNKDEPHKSEEDKLNRKPFCTDGSTCFYYAPVAGFNNGDQYAGNKGAYACTAVASDCGTGPGKPCCPFADKIATNPQLKRTGCADRLFCNYDFTPTAAAAAELKLDHMPASAPGTCEANTAECGQFGKGCCILTGPSSTLMSCGARWNETGQRGYCADPFDSNNSAGPQTVGAMAGRRALLDSSSSSGGGGGNGSSSSSSNSSSGKKKATYKELVCTPCPLRTDNVANNPSKYWPC